MYRKVPGVGVELLTSMLAGDSTKSLLTYRAPFYASPKKSGVEDLQKQPHGMAKSPCVAAGRKLFKSFLLSFRML